MNCKKAKKPTARSVRLSKVDNTLGNGRLARKKRTRDVEKKSKGGR